MSREVYLLAAARTPIGSFQGALATLAAPELGARAIRACVDQASIDGAGIDEVLLHSKGSDR